MRVKYTQRQDGEVVVANEANEIKIECDEFVSAGGCDDEHCGNACSYVEPYGFVPEADCPVHDPPRRTSTPRGTP